MLAIGTLFRPDKHMDKKLDGEHIERWMEYEGTKKLMMKNKFIAIEDRRSSRYSQGAWEKIATHVKDRIPRIFENARRSMIKAIHKIFVSKCQLNNGVQWKL